jgi:hypothetical protein
MRTTLDVDADVLRAARSLAAAEGKTIGQALSELARRGLARRTEAKNRSRFPRFEVEPGAPPITLGMVKDALDGH